MMLKKLPKYLMITTCSLGATFLTASTAFADADISVQNVGTVTAATTNVDISVVIPRVLIFGLGAVGTGIADVEWNIAAAATASTGDNQTYSGASGTFSAPAPLDSAAVASINSNGGTGSAATNVVSLPVFMFSNSGDVTITTTTAGGNTGGGTADTLDESGAGTGTIAISDFVGGDGGDINHPALTTGATATVSATSGLVNEADTWTYAYTPTSTPVAGTYEARITYVASQP